MNLAGHAHAALTAGAAPDRAAVITVPTRLDSATQDIVADTCVRDSLGFVLLLHRRKDGLVAEEIYFSIRGDDGSWSAADHISGGLLGIEPTDPREVEEALRGQPLALFSESETDVFTGRPQADEGYELMRIHEFLVDRQLVDHLDIEDTTPGAGSASSRTRKTLTSQAAVIALFPGETVSVRAMTKRADGPLPLGEPLELTGPQDEPRASVVESWQIDSD
ncbi:hypothetical protein ACWF94_14910 [Streptomyces sp. NPDC055078]